MQRLFVIAAITVAIVVRSPVFSASPDPVARLTRATTFCMLCEIHAGTIVSYDDAFIAILHERGAAAQLQRVFDHGTIAAKLYALTGLHELSRELFERDAAQLATSRASVVTLATVERGVVHREPVEARLRLIQQGAHKLFVQLAREHKM